jgi:hypothetical protein
MTQGKQKRVNNPKKTVGGVIPANLSDLSKHAIGELSLIKEDPKIILWYVSVIEAFNIMQLPQEAADHCVATLTQLLRYGNLAPLTDEPREWVQIGDELWQSIRNRDAFSNNGGKTYKLYSENNDVEHQTMKMGEEDVIS